MFRVACKSCGKVEKITVRPQPGVDMYCMACFGQKNNNPTPAPKSTD